MNRRRFVLGISLIAIFILNVFYVEYQFFLLLVLLCGILVESYLMYAITSFKIGKRVKLTKKGATRGNSVWMRVIDNKGGLLGRGVVKVSCKYPHLNDEEALALELCDGFGKRMGCVKFTPKYSGKVILNIEKIDIYDYLKVFHKRIKCEERLIINVLPPLVKSDVVIDDSFIGSDFGTDASSGLKGYSDETFELREYVETDSLKNVHWKLSSRCLEDDLIVKDHMQGMVNQCSILVDTTLKNGEDYRDRLESVYERALALGSECLRDNVRGAFIACDANSGELYSFIFDSRNSLLKAMMDVMDVQCTPNALDMAREMMGELANPVVVSIEEN